MITGRTLGAFLEELEKIARLAQIKGLIAPARLPIGAPLKASKGAMTGAMSPHAAAGGGKGLAGVSFSGPVLSAAEQKAAMMAAQGAPRRGLRAIPGGKLVPAPRPAVPVAQPAAVPGRLVPAAQARAA